MKRCNLIQPDPINSGNYAWAGGLSFSLNESPHKEALIDINGDGLVDRVKGSLSALEVAFNTGTGFTGFQTWDSGARYISTSEAFSVSGNFYMNPGWCIVNFCFNINPGGNGAVNANRTSTSLQDVNGDGYVDYLVSHADNQLQVGASRIGTTNTLKTVHRPLGSKIHLEYARSGNTYAQPQNVWVMSKVTVEDGPAAGWNNDGARTMATAYHYEDGFQDRFEREFYGFARITASALDTQSSNATYRTSRTDYLNRDYYRQGLAISSQTSDASGNVYNRSQTTYQLIGSG